MTIVVQEQFPLARTQPPSSSRGMKWPEPEPSDLPPQYVPPPRSYRQPVFGDGVFGDLRTSGSLTVLVVLGYFALTQTEYHLFWVIVFWSWCLGFLAYKIADWLSRDKFDADEKRRLEELNASYYRALQSWENTRPAALIRNAVDPVAAAKAIVANAGTVYLGVDPTTRWIRAANRESSVLVLAGARRGKTNLVVIPAVATHPGPVVSTSIKDDVMQATLPMRLGEGRKAWIFDPAAEVDVPQVVTVAHWSPLWESRTWKDAQLQAMALVGSTPIAKSNDGWHWSKVAENALAPLLFAASMAGHLTIATVRQWALRGNFEEPTMILRHIISDLDSPHRYDASLALDSLYVTANAEERHRDGAIQTVATVLAAYNFRSGIESAIDINFDPAAFVRSRDTLYICSPTNMQAALAPIITGLIDAVAQAAYSLNREQPFMRSERPGVLLALDETANIAPINQLPSYLSQGGGQGVQVMVCLQSMTQADEHWPQAAKGFLDYFGATLAFAGLSDERTLNALSVKSGDLFREYKTLSVSDTTNDGVTSSHTTNFGSPPSFGSTTRGTSSGSSHTSGWSVTTRKERRYSPADISTQPMEQALLYYGDFVGKVDLSGIYDDPWRTVFYNAHQRQFNSHPEPPLLRTVEGAAMPSLGKLWAMSGLEKPVRPYDDLPQIPLPRRAKVNELEDGKFTW